MAVKNCVGFAHAFAIRLMQHLVVPTFVLDATGQVIIWNRACERLTGVPAEELLGTRDHWRAFYESRRKCLADFLVLGKTDEIASLYISPTELGENNQGLRAETWCVMPCAGKRLYLAVDAGPIYDEDGTLVAVVETLRDMTEQKLAQMALQSLAIKDGLTGLANRRSFDETFEAEWLRARREQTELSILFADVDHFKLYNDTYGHQEGDRCLRAVAAVIDEQVFRPADLAARYGGEEFAVIMPTTDHEGALQVAERIREAVQGLNIAHAGSTTGPCITLSIGLATVVPTPEVESETVVAAADKALYAAKRGGRNRIVSAVGLVALE